MSTVTSDDGKGAGGPHARVKFERPPSLGEYLAIAAAIVLTIVVIGLAWYYG
jgi:hypothetical protein